MAYILPALLVFAAAIWLLSLTTTRWRRRRWQARAESGAMDDSTMGTRADPGSADQAVARSIEHGSEFHAGWNPPPWTR